MLATSLTQCATWAQTACEEKVQQAETVRASPEAAQGKDSVRATDTRIGKGRQALRDIAQSITVVTERPVDDRNRDSFDLDCLEVLRGSASMLFGRGSTGGEVNPVSKSPRRVEAGQIDLTQGSHQHLPPGESLANQVSSGHGGAV